MSHASMGGQYHCNIRVDERDEVGRIRERPMVNNKATHETNRGCDEMRE